MHEYKVVLLPKKTLKQSAPNCPLEPFVYYKYQNNEKLCIVNCLNFHLAERDRRTDPKHGNLIITHGRSHRNPSGDTMGRWVKEELSPAGIDITCYKAHSC